MSRSPLSAYVHVPFCRVRCGYCDFNTYTADQLGDARREDFVDHVLREIELCDHVLTGSRSGKEPRAWKSVFFGGGTPTLLPATELLRVLDALRARRGLTSDAEVTVEANPDSVDATYLRELVEGGVTRVSFGVQSVSPHVLSTLDRTHDPSRVPHVVAWAQQVGLEVSIDLIYGTPGESLADWERSLEFALSLGTGHISAYALIVEDGTALERRIRRGEMSAPDDDLLADMYERAETLLSAGGFDWYEVSNWARSPSQRSQHNLAYWLTDDWWGFGPGAHSHVGGVRWWNVKHPQAYAQRISAGVSPAAARETVDDHARHLETVLLGMRLRDGLDAAELRGYGRTISEQLCADGLLEPEDFARGRLVLTLRGRLLADYVVRRLTESDESATD